MTSITFHYRAHSREKGNAGSLFVRVIHKRKTGSFTLPYKIHPDEWDQTLQRVCNISTDQNRQKYISTVNHAIAGTRQKLQEIIQDLSNKQPYYHVKDILQQYQFNQGGLQAMKEQFSEELQKEGRFRTARAYCTAVKRLLGYCGKSDLSADELTDQLMIAFEAYLKKENLTANTISFYFRNLRALYNRGVERGFISNFREHPFRRVFTGVSHTPKRALESEEIKRLERVLQQPEKLTTTQLDSLHLFLFSFHAQGMSFVDLAHLKKKDMVADELNYFRKKSGQRVQLILTSEARRHIRYFSNRQKNSDYLFPIITNEEKSNYLQYCNGLNIQNRRLKEIQKKVRLSRPLTMHQARHSWATIALRQLVSEELISAALGHSSLMTTRIYLDGFGRPLLKKATEKVSRSVKV